MLCHLCRGQRPVSDVLFATRRFSVNFHGRLSSDVCSGVSTAEVVSVCVGLGALRCVCVRSNVIDHPAHSFTSQFPSCVDTTGLCLFALTLVGDIYIQSRLTLSS